MALGFAREGATVTVSDIVEQRAVETVRAIAEMKGAAISVVGDISNPGYSEELVKKTKKEFGKLDIVVNNAGIPDGSLTVDEMPIDVWNEVLAVNLSGPFYLAHAAIPTLLEAKRGVIINIASVSGLISAGGPAYSCSKHGLIALTQSIGATYGPDGIRCVAICPGMVETNISAKVTAPLSARAQRRRDMKYRPAQTRPETIVVVVLFAASSVASHINGTSIVVDDGMLVT
jgi:NAD(P)-dependent dehydrogenase (short-subunit alcohol dehydrogenase family)